MLPKLSKSNTSSINSLKSIDDIESLKKNFNPFFSKISKIYEIKIYLKNTFHKTDIDDKFISELEKEYAEQFLIKIDYLPTKDLIKKILTLKPIELCDFHLSTENVKINDKEKEEENNSSSKLLIFFLFDLDKLDLYRLHLFINNFI